MSAIDGNGALHNGKGVGGGQFAKLHKTEGAVTLEDSWTFNGETLSAQDALDQFAEDLGNRLSPKAVELLWAGTDYSKGPESVIEQIGANLDARGIRVNFRTPVRQEAAPVESVWVTAAGEHLNAADALDVFAENINLDSNVIDDLWEGVDYNLDPDTKFGIIKTNAVRMGVDLNGIGFPLREGEDPHRAPTESEIRWAEIEEQYLRASENRAYGAVEQVVEKVVDRYPTAERLSFHFPQGPREAPELTEILDKAGNTLWGVDAGGTVHGTDENGELERETPATVAYYLSRVGDMSRVEINNYVDRATDGTYSLDFKLL